MVLPMADGKLAMAGSPFRVTGEIFGDRPVIQVELALPGAGQTLVSFSTDSTTATLACGIPLDLSDRSPARQVLLFLPVV